MLQKNKFTTYILYAIGEIFLVVVGILIAVSIDNANENRKGRELEVKYLKNIKLDLEKDIDMLDMVIAFRHEKISACDVLMQHMRNEKVPDLTDLSNSIRKLIWEGQFSPINTTFSELSSSGNLNIISNDTIKNVLFELQNLYKDNDAGVAHETFDYHEYISKSMLNEVNLDILADIFDGKITIEEAKLGMQDFEPLMKSKAYRNGVIITKSMSKNFLNTYDEIKSKSEQIISMINRELE